LEGCTRKSTTSVPSGSGSRRRRAVQRKGACSAAGAGDARPIEMVRREGGQPALDQGACRSASAGHMRGLLLPARSGDHRCDRPVRREGARQPRLLTTSPMASVSLISRQLQIDTNCPIAVSRPSPRESAKPADLNPAGFCMTRNSSKSPPPVGSRWRATNGAPQKIPTGYPKAQVRGSLPFAIKGTCRSQSVAQETHLTYGPGRPRRWGRILTHGADPLSFKQRPDRLGVVGQYC
jgi:hypothetical protein